jgi:anti-sigma B factor antagonist
LTGEEPLATLTINPDFRTGPLVSVFGEVDLSNCSELRETLDGLGTPATSVVDMSGVDFMDSTGLGVLARYRKNVREVGGTVYLVIPQRFLRHIFTISRLDREFTIVENLADVP